MLEFIASFLVYLLAFAIGSVLALLTARRLYPAMSADEALTDLGHGPNGVIR